MVASALIERIQAITKGEETEVCFANYLEESVVSVITSVLVYEGRIILLHEDGGELGDAEESEITNPVKWEDWKMS